MKKSIRIIIPVILTLAIILCLGWYLTIYDREFTRDMLLHGARFFEGQGNHETAAWFYDLAYQQASDNDAVAIELAQHHKAAGNYTKAEFVLSNAIADGGGAELYTALCQTYVEQDKLLDAVKLMDAVCQADSSVDPAVRQTLLSLRPAAPIVAPSPGFYSQYISVTLEAPSGTLYVNTAGEYPSVKTDAYMGPITLKLGENTLCAVAVADNGLVSPRAIFGYTVGGVIEEVTFADPAIEAQIRKALKLSGNAIVLTSDLWRITEFTIPAEANNYSDLKYLTHLESLTIENGTSGHLQSISGATKLTALRVTDTAVTADELKIIGALPSLQSLTLSNCSLSTTAGLEKAVNLTYLDLSKNTIRNITALSSLPALQEVYLQHNALTDLSALSAASHLKVLDVSNNALTSLSPVCGISSLSTLRADSNTLLQLDSMDRLTSLTELSLAYNQLADITALQNCIMLEKLNISNNALTDIAVLGTLGNLAQLDFSYNQVTALPQWSTDCALIRIDGSHNLLTSLDTLSGLPRLNAVYMDYNKEIASVSKLADCPVLILVSVYGTKVKEVNSLTVQSIIVHYDPTKA